jgi:hypothetical protein
MESGQVGLNESFFYPLSKNGADSALILLAYLFMESIQAGYKTGRSLFS